MRRRFLLLLSAALLLVPAARGADDQVKAILTKAVKAHGGAAALSKYRATRSKAKGTIVIPGAGEVEFTQEASVMFPDKFKESMELVIAGNTVRVVTVAKGGKVSLEVGGKELPLTDAIKDAIAEARQVMKMSRLPNLLKDKAFELSALGEVKVEGKPAVGVRVSSKGAKDLNLYFDKTTGLLAKTERRATDPNTGKECTEERIVLEYGKPNEFGIRLPKKALVKRDGKKLMETEVTEITQSEKLDDSEFDK